MINRQGAASTGEEAELNELMGSQKHTDTSRLGETDRNIRGEEGKISVDSQHPAMGHSLEMPP